MRVLVTIPVFNEARYVARVLSQVQSRARDILVVDDGSTDETPAILRAFSDIHVIRHAINLGYGRSLIDAFGFAQRAGYDWVITMDCDEQHEPARLPAFVERARLGDCDIVSGSRYLHPVTGAAAPSDRRRINQIVTRMLNRTLGLQLTDAFCGFKAHRVSAMARLSLTEPGYAFPLEFWVQAVHAGLQIREIPVRLIYNDPTRHFGGRLDDPASRLRHYRTVFAAALKEAEQKESQCKLPYCCCSVA